MDVSKPKDFILVITLHICTPTPEISQMSSVLYTTYSINKITSAVSCPPGENWLKVPDSQPDSVYSDDLMTAIQQFTGEIEGWKTL